MPENSSTKTAETHNEQRNKHEKSSAEKYYPNLLVSEVPRPYYPNILGLELKGNSFRGHPHLSIFESHDGHLCLNNFSTTKDIEIPRGNALAVAAGLYNLDTTTKEGLKEAIHTVCQFAGLNASRYIVDQADNYIPTVRPKRKPAATKTIQYTPNQGTIKSHGKPIYCEWSDPIGKAVFESLFKKTGVTIELLNSLGVRPLEGIRWKSGGLERFTPERPAIAYIAGANINIKRLNPKQGQSKEAAIQSAGNYVFGLERLQQQKGIEGVFFCEGETDTITFNQLFNKYGFYAICLRGCNANIPKQLIKQLSKLTDHIGIIHDNDLPGIISQLKHLQQHPELNGLFIGQAANYMKGTYTKPDSDKLKALEDARQHQESLFPNGFNTSLNDICDLYQQLGAEGAEDLILNLTNYKTKPTRAIIEYDRYIPAEAVKSYIQGNDQIILKASTGAGKTTMAKALASDQGFLNDIGVRKVVILVPKLAIGENIIASLEGRDVLFVNEKTQQSEISAWELSDEPLIVSTYHSAHRIDTSDKLVIGDEMHALKRLAADINITDALFKARKLLLMSATPFIIPGMFYIEATTENTQKKEIRINYYNGRYIDAPIPATGTHILYIDSKAEARAMFKYIGKEAVLLTAKDKGKAYQKIVNEGRIPSGKRFIICTSVIKEGANIYDQIDAVHILKNHGKLSPEDIIQIPARARRDGETNSTLKVYVHLKKDKHLDINAQYAEGVRINKDRIFEGLKSEAVKTCETFNNAIDLGGEVVIDRNRLKNDTLNLIDLKGGKYIPNVLLIAARAEHEYNCKCSYLQIFEDVERIDSGAEVVEITESEHPFNYELNECIKAEKNKAKEANEAAFELFESKPKECLTIVRESTKNRKLKAGLRAEKLPTFTHDHGVLYEDNKELFEVIEQLAARYIELKSIGISTTEAIGHILNNRGTEAYKTKYNALVIAHMKVESIKDQHIQDRAKKVQKRIRQGKQNGQKLWNATELIEIYTGAGYSKYDVSHRSIKNRLAELFEFRKKGRLYEIGKRHSRASLAIKCMTNSGVSKCHNLSCGKPSENKDNQLVRLKT